MKSTAGQVQYSISSSVGGGGGHSLLHPPIPMLMNVEGRTTTMDEVAYPEFSVRGCLHRHIIVCLITILIPSCFMVV